MPRWSIPERLPAAGNPPFRRKQPAPIEAMRGEMNLSIAPRRGDLAPNVFRGDMTFRNSDAGILRFPFPLDTDRFEMKGVGIAPQDRTGPTEAYRSLFDIDEHYLDEVAERAFVLDRDRTHKHVMLL